MLVTISELNNEQIHIPGQNESFEFVDDATKEHLLQNREAQNTN